MLYHVGTGRAGVLEAPLTRLVANDQIFSTVHEYFLRHICVAASTAFVPLHTDIWDGSQRHTA
jgi:hypothetical protein